MHWRVAGRLFLAGLSITASPAFALEFMSLAQPALLYDAPSSKSVPRLIARAGTPVEPIVALDAFVKVREPQGALVWVEKKNLSDKRMAMVRVDRAQVQKAADEKAALAFEAERDVLLELTGPASNGWVPVRHRDGSAGFVRITQIFGR